MGSGQVNLNLWTEKRIPPPPNHAPGPREGAERARLGGGSGACMMPCIMQRKNRRPAKTARLRDPINPPQNRKNRRPAPHLSKNVPPGGTKCTYRNKFGPSTGPAPAPKLPLGNF